MTRQEVIARVAELDYDLHDLAQVMMYEDDPAEYAELAVARDQMMAEKARLMKQLAGEA